MAWIASHQELAAHPKLLDFCAALDISIPLAIGHLHLFWYWALDQAEDGNLQGMTPTHIAFGAKWNEDANMFYDALVSSNFIDVDENSTPTIHNWLKYHGRYIEKKEQGRRRKAEHDARRRELENIGNADVTQSNADVTRPHEKVTPTEQYITEDKIREEKNESEKQTYSETPTHESALNLLRQIKFYEYSSEEESSLRTYLIVNNIPESVSESVAAEIVEKLSWNAKRSQWQFTNREGRTVYRQNLLMIHRNWVSRNGNGRSPPNRNGRVSLEEMRRRNDAGASHGRGFKPVQ